MTKQEKSGMRIICLSLRNFRSYKEALFDLDSPLTVFVGENAVGKTNIIEALQLLTTTESFRKPSWSDVIFWGEDRSVIKINAVQSQGNRTLDIEMRIEGNQRKFFINGKQKKKLSEVKGIIPAVLFTPEDLQLIKESAEKRRTAIDSFGSQMAPAYEAIKNDYEKVLKHRNTLLKSGVMTQDVFEPWTDKLIEVGTAFYSHRRKLFERLIPHIQNLYSTISSGEVLTAQYIPSWESVGVCNTDPKEAFKEALDKEILQEQARGTTLIGPQRDEIIFFIQGKNARLFGSQGQQRSIVLAWKLAEIEVIHEVTGKDPILLLDDVMSELDKNRRAALTEFVGERVQTFITTTTTQYFDEELLKKANVFTYSGDRFKEDRIIAGGEYGPIL